MSERKPSHRDPGPAAPDLPAAAPPWWQRRPVWAVAIAILIVLAIVISSVLARRGGHGGGATPAVPVVTATARRGNFTVYQSAPGTVTPLHTVVVRSQVEGRLASIAFHDGQMVKKGELLATIDPKPFQAKLQLATGGLAHDEALLESAQDTLKRYQTLLTQASIAQQRVDDQASLVRQYQAAVQADQGRIDLAKLELGHTRITSPIGGMVGLRRVDPGNFVGPSDGGGIVVVTQLRPTSVVFAVPAEVMPKVLDEWRAGTPVPVVAYGADHARLASGRLLGVNNEVDPATGTVKLKAGFKNADSGLFPNQAVTVQLPVESIPGAILVPAAAVQSGATGPFVYVVKPDQTVAVAKVQTGPGDGTTTVIEHGVAPGTGVVVEGADRLRAGSKIETVARPAGAAGSSAAAPGSSVASGAHAALPAPTDFNPRGADTAAP